MSFSPLDVLDEIWDLTESVSEGFLTYSFMLSLSDFNQSEVIEAFNSTSRSLDYLLNIDYTFFDSMVNQIYPSELQSNKANVSDSEASFLDLHLSISDGFVKTKIFVKKTVWLWFWYCEFSISRWWCSSFDILWCLYFSTYSFCSKVQSCRWL